MNTKSQEFFGFEGLRNRSQKTESLNSMLDNIQKKLGEKSTITSMGFSETIT